MSKPVRPRGRPSSRDAMLDAAEAVVLTRGVGKLSLDAVAKQDGDSKGGVMYNYPSKEALLAALIERLVEQNVTAQQRTAARLKKGPSRELKGYVINSLRDLDRKDRVSGALIAAVSGHPRLLEKVAEYFRARFVRLAQDVPFERAAIVHLATEGLWFMELMGVSPLDKRQRARVARLLQKLADGGVEL